MNTRKRLSHRASRAHIRCSRVLAVFSTDSLKRLRKALLNCTREHSLLRPLAQGGLTGLRVPLHVPLFLSQTALANRLMYLLSTRVIPAAASPHIRKCLPACVVLR